MARFAIVDDHLYAINQEDLNIINVEDPKNPSHTKETSIGVGIETIFPRDKETLFIGARNGMYIYDISKPTEPKKLSRYRHIASCDPVVADQNYAYVTLNNLQNTCRRGGNLLQVIDIANLNNPYRVNQRVMEGPRGLGIDGNQLFVADNGLKVFDVQNPATDIQLDQHFQDVSAKDVIPLNDLLLVIADDALVQYDYSKDNLQELSRILFKVPTLKVKALIMRPRNLY